MANRYVPIKTRLADAVSLESMLLSGPSISNPFLDSTVSTEDIKEIGKKVWEWIKTLFKKLFEKLKGLFSKAKVTEKKAEAVAKETANVAKQIGLSKDTQISVSYPSLGFIKGSESGNLSITDVLDAISAAKGYANVISTNFRGAINNSNDIDPNNLADETAVKILFSPEVPSKGISGKSGASEKLLNLINVSSNDLADNHYVATALNYPNKPRDSYTITVKASEYETVARNLSDSLKDTLENTLHSFKKAEEARDKIFATLERNRNATELAKDVAALYANTFRLVDTEVTKALMLYNSGLDIIAACNKKISGGQNDTSK